MVAKKFQVFVSSTFRDLAEERSDAIRNILDLNHIPAGMELFPAADSDQLEYIKKVIDECDYYVLIVGGRYGSIDKEGISFTEREYDYAVGQEKVVLAFVREKTDEIPVGKSEIERGAIEALNTFREKVCGGRLVKYWNTREELAMLVLKGLMHAFNNSPQIGWVRGDSIASDLMVSETNKILQENAKLHQEILTLKGSMAPNVNNIADLSEMVEIKFTTRYYRNSEFSYTQHSQKLVWKNLFLSVAGVLDTPKTNSAITSGFRIAAKNAGFNGELYEIDATDVVRIKVQFLALGLIDAEVGLAKNGSSYEFLSLTPRGRAIFIEELSTKSTRTNS
jgi:hypothetical protein